MNSIIIPSYCPTIDVLRLQQRCIRSIMQHTWLPFELIVVENGTVDTIKEKDLDINPSSPIQQFARLKHNNPLGFAKAVNAGVGLAEGAYFFIVNNDVIVPAGWDKGLLDAYRAVPSMGLLSPVDHPAAPGYLIDHSWWSCVLISRGVWDTVGDLDQEKLNYRFHDQDWSCRCKKAGYVVARWGGVRVEHVESSTYRHMPVQQEESKERQEMIARWGAPHFADWVQLTAK